MIIKMANEFKLTVFARPTRCKSLHARGFTAGQQNCVGSGPLGRRGPWAAGPLGRRAVAGRGPLGRSGPWAAGRWAVAGRGPRAAGPSGRRAAGPWRACF